MAKKILSLNIDSLTLDPNNARKHSEPDIQAIARSLEQFKQQTPIVVTSDNIVIKGNGTVLAAKSLSWTKIEAIRTELTGQQVSAYSIADNRTAELSEWDNVKLLEMLEGFDEQALIDSCGFDEDAMIALAESVKPTIVEPIVEDEVPEPPVVPITKKGDLWILGQHRLLCGDSTKVEDVARLMDGKRAALMNTDPPYGVGYANEDRPNPGVAKPRVAKPRVANDGLCDEKLQEFLEACFKAAVGIALHKNAAWYMWHAHLTQGYFAAAAAAAAANVVLHRQIIWVKAVLLLGRGHYHWKHEPCFMGWVKGNQPPDYGEGAGERTQTTIWEVGSVTHAERREFNHSTPKPVKLFAIPIVKHTVKGDVVYEPFMGSGPQLIAAEQLNRKCYGIEIDPQYVDVCVKRWENLTGNKAVLAQ